MLGFACHESFLRKMATLTRSTKVFSLESFPLYGNTKIEWIRWCGDELFTGIGCFGVVVRSCSLVLVVLVLW